MQSIIAVLLGTSSAYGQYNVDHLVGPYEDTPVLTSLVEVGNGHVISVGTITTTLGSTQQKDILLTKTDSLGNVVWNYRYGQPDQVETGNGITLNWNGDHVIVVGSVYYSDSSGIGTPMIPVRDAITLKVRISDGALIWTTTHGTFSYDEEALMIERTNDGLLGDRSYVVIGQSSGDTAQSSVRMYAFKLNESGGEVWSRRYLLSNNFPIIAVRPSSVVPNGFSRLMIAGIRSEVNRPTKLFTTGISTIDGSVTDDFVEYTTSNIYHVKDCAISRDPDGSGFVLAFTTDNFYGPCLAASTDPLPTSADRIGVMRLYPSRKVQWTNIYWNQQAANQRGIAVDVKGGLYNIGTSYSLINNVERPGFLRVDKTTSAVVDCHLYQSSTLRPTGVMANCMIPSKDGGYIMKNFAHPNDGFSLIKMSAAGKSNCNEQVQIVRCTTPSTADAKKSSAQDYGSVALNYSPRYAVFVNSQLCYNPFGTKSNIAAQTPTTKMVIYPSPVGENEEIVNIKFSTELDNKEATVHVLNSLGQEVLTYKITTSEGENFTHFNAQKLSSGMHTIVIDTDQEILERGKLLKK